MQSLPAKQRHVEPDAVLTVEKQRQALVHARMVNRVIATLDIAGTGQVLQSTFATWWRSHQVPELSVMDKLNFSRPISKHFAANGGALSTVHFRELLAAMLEKEAKSEGAAELDAEQMNAWLGRLLQL